MLSTEQQKLIEDNHNIIYQVMKDMSINPEEFYGICAIAMCKASRDYKENNNCKFSTFAYAYIANAVKREYLHRSRKVRCKDHLVLHSQDMVSSDGKDSFIDLLPANYDIENECIDNVTYERVLDALDDRKRVILINLMNGKTLKEIAIELNISHQAVDQSRKAIAKIVNRYHLIERG